MSVKPSARSNSSATYRGAKQMLLEIGNRTVVVSGGASWANESGAPVSHAAPADESVARKRRRLCVDCMTLLLLPLNSRWGAYPRRSPHLHVDRDARASACLRRIISLPH